MGGFRELWFLEVTCTETPRGLVLVRNGVGEDGAGVSEGWVLSDGERGVWEDGLEDEGG